MNCTEHVPKCFINKDGFGNFIEFKWQFAQSVIVVLWILVDDCTVQYSTVLFSIALLSVQIVVLYYVFLCTVRMFAVKCSYATCLLCDVPCSNPTTNPQQFCCTSVQYVCSDRYSSFVFFRIMLRSCRCDILGGCCMSNSLCFRFRILMIYFFFAFGNFFWTVLNLLFIDALTYVVNIFKADWYLPTMSATSILMRIFCQTH